MVCLSLSATGLHMTTGYGVIAAKLKHVTLTTCTSRIFQSRLAVLPQPQPPQHQLLRTTPTATLAQVSLQTIATASAIVGGAGQQANHGTALTLTADAKSDIIYSNFLIPIYNSQTL